MREATSDDPLTVSRRSRLEVPLRVTAAISLLAWVGFVHFVALAAFSNATGEFGPLISALATGLVAYAVACLVTAFAILARWHVIIAILAGLLLTTPTTVFLFAPHGTWPWLWLAPAAVWLLLAAALATQRSSRARSGRR